jgi:uncharacterized protein
VPLYRDSVAGVHAEIEAGRLVPRLTEQFRFSMGHAPSPAEVRSWDRSLAPLTQVMVDAGLSSVEMLVEYRLPLTSKRADVVLCGVHPKTGDLSYVVVELKQWSHAAPLEGTDDVVITEALGPRLHPIEQVRRYCIHLSDFVASLGGELRQLSGFAYLHNARDDDVVGLWDLPSSAQGMLFTGQRRGSLISHLKSLLAPTPGAEAADELTSSAIRPSKQLLALAAEEVQNRESFVLLDEQRTAYSLVMRAVDRSRKGSRKQVIIVTGGPGSGKSVIALSLLGELSRQGRSVLHATGSSAFTQTLRKVAGSRAPRVRALFRYYNQFIDAEPNGIDVLINDEAHRVKETSTNRFTPAKNRTGRPQVEELIDAARVPVFLLDQHQVVRPSERGTITEIDSAAKRMDCEVVRIDLDGQFRCGGSRVYEYWVLRLLGLEPGGPVRWKGDESFELDVADGPSLMEARLRQLLDSGYSSRISAGYCWEWSTPRQGELVADIKIGEWHRPWNNPKDTQVGEAPGRPFWASDPAGFGQVGCIYTAQGFEYDYSGVIIGPDFVWRDGSWVARRENSHDRQVKGAAPAEFDRVIRNTYKVLLTRGMRGTTVFSADPETQGLLRSLIP